MVERKIMHVYHFCAMWQKTAGTETYVNGTIKTNADPFDDSFSEQIIKVVSEKYQTLADRLIIISLTKID